VWSRTKVKNVCAKERGLLRKKRAYHKHKNPEPSGHEREYQAMQSLRRASCIAQNAAENTNDEPIGSGKDGITEKWSNMAV
jgi:hypothetical protein